MFAGDDHYPHPGVESLVFASDSKNVAIHFAKKMEDSVLSLTDGMMVCDSRYSDGMPEWWQVFDTQTLKIVDSKGFDCD